MNLVKPHKFMDFMTNVYVNMEMQMSGDISRIYSIIYLLLH